MENNSIKNLITSWCVKKGWTIKPYNGKIMVQMIFNTYYFETYRDVYNNLLKNY